MRKLCSAFLFFAMLGSQSCSSSAGNLHPELHTISIMDRNGMSEVISNPERIKQYRTVDFLCPQPYDKVVRIHNRLKNGNIPSFLHSYHENGQSKQYLEVMNSRAQGVYKEWHPNGRLKLQAYVIGGEADLSESAERTWIFDGEADAWDEEGCLQAQIVYEKGVLSGNSIYYHPNGAFWKIVPFKDGQIDGVSQVFLSNGEPFQTSSFVQGKLHGPSVRYWPGQNIAAQEEFSQDKLLFGRYYSPAGAQICAIDEGNGHKALFGKTSLVELHEFRKGIPEGEVKIFDTEQRLQRAYSVKNNLKHGQDIEYYTEGTPKMLVTWYEGKIQGIAKSWYDNGVQESSREMSQNAKNGVAIAWYRDGSLMLIEEYQTDKLLKGEYYRRGEKRPISEVKQGSGIATLFDSEGNFVVKVAYENSIPSEDV